MRILVWNIRAGGGRRVASILQEVVRINPDICAFSEFRGTPPSRWLAAELTQLGFTHQRKARGLPVTNTVFLASKLPLRKVAVQGAPQEPGRWLSIKTDDLNIALVHIPNESTGRKGAFLSAVVDVARRWKNRPALIVGDTNSGRPELDEENAVFDARYTAWFDALEDLGWVDMFRHLHRDKREFTWYSPNKGNGFRLDQVFVSRPMSARTQSFQHVWAGSGGEGSGGEGSGGEGSGGEGSDGIGRARRDIVSDHAAIVASFD